MRAGSLDRKITLQQHTVDRDGYGDEVKVWADLATDIWARRIPLTGREYTSASAEQKVAGMVNRYQIRYRADVRQGMQLRILDDGLVYDIKHIAEIGRRQGLELVGEALGQT